MCQSLSLTKTLRIWPCVAGNCCPWQGLRITLKCIYCLQNPCVARTLISSQASTNCFIVYKTIRRVELCLAKQADTLYLTGSVIWQEFDRVLSEQFKTSETRAFCYRGWTSALSDMKNKHVSIDVTWFDIHTLVFLPKKKKSQGPDWKQAKRVTCRRFGGSHPSQAEGQHRIVWGLKSGSLPPYEVTQTHPHTLS